MLPEPLFDLGPFTDTAKALRPTQQKIVRVLAEHGPLLRRRLTELTGLPRNTLNHELAHLTGRGHTDPDEPFAGAVKAEETKSGLEFSINPTWKAP